MTTLTEFLLARIAEDAEAARHGMTQAMYSGRENAAEEVLSMGGNEGVATAGLEHFERWMPARVLAECEAKRRIVDLAVEADDVEDGLVYERATGPVDRTQFTGQKILRSLAAVYSDHPDYREEWVK